MRAFLLVLLLCIANRALAGVGVELTGFYLADNFSQPALSSQSRYYYTAEFFYLPSRFKKLYFGANLTGLGQSDLVTSTVTNFSSQDYGLFVGYELDSAHHWNVAAAYNPVANGIYDVTGSATKTWTGSSFWGRFGYQVALKKGFYIGAHFTYYSVDYTSQIQSGVTQGVSIHRDWILPVLSISYQR